MLHDVAASTPFVLAQGGRIFISGNTGSEMLGFDGKALTTIGKAMN